MNAPNTALFSNFVATVSLPTAQGGARKASLFTSKLAELAEDRKLSVEIDGRITINGEIVSPAAIVACALEPATRKGADLSITALVGLWSAGYCNSLQAKQAGESVSPPSFDPDRMSSEDYLSVQFSLNLVRENAHKFEELYLRFNRLSEKERTKMNFESIIDSMFLILFPAEKRETHAAIIEREKLALKEFASLSELGIENIKRAGETILGFIPRSHIDSALAGIVSTGYGLTAHSLRDDFSGLDVTLSKTVEKL